MDWMTQLAQYVPQTPQEAADKAALQNDVQKYGTAVLERSSPSGSHICCSGMVLDPTMTQVLLVYHNIYQSFSWTGGHADGESDFLAVAIREAQEETGLQQVQPLCSAILSIDRLPVKAHIRRGEPVAAHFHDCISFGLLADPKQPLRIQPAENSAVCWKPIAELPELCQEPHMLPVYEKLIARMKRYGRNSRRFCRRWLHRCWIGMRFIREICRGGKTRTPIMSGFQKLCCNRLVSRQSKAIISDS